MGAGRGRRGVAREFSRIRMTARPPTRKRLYHQELISKQHLLYTLLI